jgi:hypothetical protein
MGFILSFIHSSLFIVHAVYIGLSGIPLLLVTQPDSQVPNVHSDQLAAAVTPAQVNVHLYIAPGDTARLTGTKCPLWPAGSSCHTCTGYCSFVHCSWWHSQTHRYQMSPLTSWQQLSHLQRLMFICKLLLVSVTLPVSQVPNVHSDQLAAAATPAEVNVQLFFAPGDSKLTGIKCPLWPAGSSCHTCRGQCSIVLCTWWHNQTHRY